MHSHMLIALRSVIAHTSIVRRMSSQSSTYDCIIIGAGWAGAVAARDLTANGHSVVIVEARDRLGGRAQTWTSKEDSSVKVDVGCSWIHGYKEGNPARGIAEELGVDAHLPKPAEGLIYGPDGPLSSATAASLRSSLSAAQASLKTPYPPPSSDKSLASALLASNSPLFHSKANPNQSTDLSNTSPADPTIASQTSASVASGDETLAKDLARTLEIPLGLKLEKASLRWAGWESTTSFAGSDAAPEGGYEALVGKVIDQAKSKGAQVELGVKVSGIKLDADIVTISGDNGQTWSGKTAISTIPLGVLKRLPPSTFQPALPDHFQEIIKGTHVGTLEKLLLHYPTAWWPNSESTGSYTFLPTSSAPLTSSSTPLEILSASTLVTASFNAPSLPGPSPTLLTYLSETPATLLLDHPPEKVASSFHEFLTSRFKPSTPPPAPIESSLTNWLTDEYSYGATTTPSVVSDSGERSPMDFKELGRPVWGGKLGFAGEHTEMEHRGSVAGAVISGQREGGRVDRLLNLLKA